MSLTDLNRTFRRDWLICILLLAATAGVYWPVTEHEFINYDDPLYVTANPHVQAGLTAGGVAWAFGRVVGEGTYWHPITWLTHMLDCQLFRMQAGWHHATNLLFHLANVILIFIVLKRMTGAEWRSAMVAALFALHPLQVDTVAWISERKNVLSTFFCLLTLLAYCAYARRGGRSRLLLVVVIFALGLMSKPMLVTVPCLLLLLDYWPLMRIASLRPAPVISSAMESPPRRWVLLIAEKLPLLVLAGISSAITILAHQRLNLLATSEQLPFLDRLGHALVSYATYLGRIFWPANLAIFYPYPASWPPEDVILSGALVAGISALALWWARVRPYLVVGWFWFLGTLVPVIGLVQAGVQSTADRFAYVPIIGIFIMVVWGAAEAIERLRLPRYVAAAVAVIVLAVNFAVTSRQLGYWQNSETLFAHTVAVTRNNFVAMLNYGVALGDHGKLDEAAAQYREALRIHPGYPEAECNLGNICGLRRQYDEAIGHYRAALERKPDYPEARFNLGNALALKGNYEAAAPEFLEALRLNPDYTEAHNNLGNAYMLEGRVDDAITQYAAAVAIRPNYVEAQSFLGRALARKKRFGEAVIHFRAALKIRPNDAAIMNDLAWILATENDVRDVPEAVRLASQACQITGQNDPLYLDTLAVAYSEAGQFLSATEVSGKAVQAAEEVGDRALAEKLHAHQDAFRASRSYGQAFGPASSPSSAAH